MMVLSIGSIAHVAMGEFALEVKVANLLLKGLSHAVIAIIIL